MHKVDVVLNGSGPVLNGIELSGGSLTLSKVRVDITATGTNATGIINAGWNLNMTNSSVIVSGGVSNSRGFDIAGGNTVLNNVDVDASGTGSEGLGIFTNMPNVEIHHSRIFGSDKGIIMGATDPTVTVFNSRIEGGNFSIARLDGVFKAEGTQFIGSLGETAELTLIQCFDDNFDPVFQLTSNFLADDSVGENQLADDAVTGAKIASETILSDNIKDNTVDLGDLDTADVDTRYVNEDGDTMGGDLNMDGHNLTNSGNVTGQSIFAGNTIYAETSITTLTSDQSFLITVNGGDDADEDFFVTADNFSITGFGLFYDDLVNSETGFVAGNNDSSDRTDYFDNQILQASDGEFFKIDVAGGDASGENFIVFADNFEIQPNGDVTAKSFTAGNSSTVYDDGSIAQQTGGANFTIDVAGGDAPGEDFIVLADNFSVDAGGNVITGGTFSAGGTSFNGNVDLGANSILNVDTVDFGAAGDDDLVANDVSTLTGNGDASALHNHDGRYYSQTELGSSGNMPGAGLIGVKNVFLNSSFSDLQNVLADFDGAITGAAVNQNHFKTINVPNGTNPVADGANDILTFLEGSGISISGNAGTDSVMVSSTSTLQNAYDNGFSITVSGGSGVEIDDDEGFSGSPNLTVRSDTTLTGNNTRSIMRVLEERNHDTSGSLWGIEVVLEGDYTGNNDTTAVGILSDLSLITPR